MQQLHSGASDSEINDRRIQYEVVSNGKNKFRIYNTYISRLLHVYLF